MAHDQLLIKIMLDFKIFLISECLAITILHSLKHLTRNILQTTTLLYNNIRTSYPHSQINASHNYCCIDKPLDYTDKPQASFDAPEPPVTVEQHGHGQKYYDDQNQDKKI